MTEHNTAQRIIARDYSEEVGLEISIYVILVKEQYMQSSTYFGRDVAAGDKDKIP